MPELWKNKLYFGDNFHILKERYQHAKAYPFNNGSFWSHSNYHICCCSHHYIQISWLPSFPVGFNTSNNAKNIGRGHTLYGSILERPASARATTIHTMAENH